MGFNTTRRRPGPDPVLLSGRCHEVRGGGVWSFLCRLLAGIFFGAVAWLTLKTCLEEARVHPLSSRWPSIVGVTVFTLIGLAFVFDACTKLIFTLEGAWMIRFEIEGHESAIRLHWRRPSGLHAGDSRLDVALAGDRALQRSKKIRRFAGYHHEYWETSYDEFWRSPPVIIEATDHRQNGSFTLVIPPEIRVTAANNGHAAQWTLRLKFRRSRWIVSDLNFQLPLPDSQD